MDVKVRTQVVERDRLRCRGCGKPGEEVHHIIFRSHGGKDEPNNLVTICRNCHNQAHGKFRVPLPGWVLQAMILYNKWRVCCGIWRFFAQQSNCITCDARTADYFCLLRDEQVVPEGGCSEWMLRSVQVHL